AVTAFGMTLANLRIPSIEETKRFKEYISILLVSLIFILITATLDWDMIDLIDWRIGAFVLVMMFFVRPLTVFISSLGAGLSWQELVFTGWIAPRGIVCVAVTGLLGPTLVTAGYPEAASLVPISFLIVFATVLAH